VQDYPNSLSPQRAFCQAFGMTRTEKLLAELIALPSVNPAFALPHDPKAGEKSVSDFLLSVGAAAGLEVELQKVLPDRSNVIIRLQPSGRTRQTILLLPHMDTVVAGDSQLTPFRRQGRLYGRGACDTKGSVAAMLTALLELAGTKSRPKETAIVFAGVVDEENAQAGSRVLAASGLKANLAIVGEPTRLQGITAHKGTVWLQMETRGRSAHGSTPHLGKNAILEMAQVVQLLETRYAGQLRHKKHRLLGAATVNVGTITGGRQPNIVPDSCIIKIDRRTLPGETEAGIIREISGLLAKQKLSARISNTKLAPSPALETNHQLPLVRRFLRTIGQNRAMGVNYFCDAAVLSAAGIPSIVFGPGDIAQAHTADEWISLASLEKGKNLLLKFLKSLD
jgi:acetylornithine deacetylase